MLALNKPDSRKVREMSFSHSQWLNADQPPKKVVFTRIIAWVAMISGLLSFVSTFIFDFVSRLFSYMRPIDFLEIPSGPVPALVGVALGLLSPPGLEGPKNLPTRGNRDPNRSRLVHCGSMDVSFRCACAHCRYGAPKAHVVTCHALDF